MDPGINERDDIMLFLNQSDIYTIADASVQDAVKEAYHTFLSGKFQMPNRVHVGSGENTLLLMPCFAGRYFATKLVSVFPGAHEYNMPAVNGMVVLCDNTTGNPIAVMDGAALTAQRTGAVGGLAVKLLTRETITAAGIFGAGTQGYFQARYLLHNRKITDLLICDPNRESAGRMARKLASQYSGLSCRAVDDPDTVVRQSQVIICATTSTTPVFDIRDTDTMPDTFIGIGSFRPDMQEFPIRVSQMVDHLFVDTPFAVEESGDLAIPIKEKTIAEGKVKPFAGIVDSTGPVPAGKVFFKSVGMALFDLMVAAMIYETAVEQNLGKKLDK